MTLGVIRSAEADRDNVYSQALRTHAKSLELDATMPVGEWTYGQGIRKAHGNHFFWELSSKNFSPLGLHHPTALVAIDVPVVNQEAPQSFAVDLLKAFPQLADWKWTIVKGDHAWMKREWTHSSAWKKKSGPWLFETDATLKGALGWQGLEEITQLKGWAVQLNSELCWIASNSDLPLDGMAAPTERAQLRVFLSADALGPHGRMQELRHQVSSSFNAATIQGLNVELNAPSSEFFSAKGLSCDDIGGKKIGLCFPLSFLKEDLAGVAKLLPGKG